MEHNRAVVSDSVALETPSSLQQDLSKMIKKVLLARLLTDPARARELGSLQIVCEVHHFSCSSSSSLSFTQILALPYFCHVQRDPAACSWWGPGLVVLVETYSHQLFQNFPHLTLLSKTIQLILYHLRYRKSLVQFEESYNLKKKTALEMEVGCKGDGDIRVAKIVLHSHSPANKNTINKVALQ